MADRSEGRDRCRIVVVSKWLNVGGAERFVSNILAHIDLDRFEVELVLFRPIVGYPIRDKVGVSALMSTRSHKWWHVPLMVLGLARRMRRLSPDVVVSAYAYPSVVTGLALRLAASKARWIARIASNPDWEENGLRRPVFRFVYRRVDRFVANSGALARRFEEVYPFADGRTHHLANPVAGQFLRIDTPVRSIHRPRLIAIGRLVPQKRMDLLLAAVAFARKHCDFELVICGEGPERHRLEGLVQDLGLDDDVRLVGFVDPVPHLSEADLFVLTSDHEGSPNALIEAQAMGLPAVATDCPFGPSEILEDGVTGWLVPVGDEQGFAAAIIEALRDGDRLRAMGRAAASRVRVTFDAAEITRRLERHIAELCEDE